MLNGRIKNFDSSQMARPKSQIVVVFRRDIIQRIFHEAVYKYKSIEEQKNLLCSTVINLTLKKQYLSYIYIRIMHPYSTGGTGRLGRKIKRKKVGLICTFGRTTACLVLLSLYLSACIVRGCGI